MTPDQANACFETLEELNGILAGVLVFNHCRVLCKDKQTRGVSLLSLIIFLSWNIYNTFYYPHLNQWYSLYGSLVLAASNILYCGMIIHYRLQERRSVRLGRQSNSTHFGCTNEKEKAA